MAIKKKDRSEKWEPISWPIGHFDSPRQLGLIRSLE